MAGIRVLHAVGAVQRGHWREYLIEAAALGAFLILACAFASLFEYAGSPVRDAIPVAWHRRALMGLAMGATAIAIIYSPWGKRSGAHLNPATTLMFYRLGKVAGVDAVFYTIAQFAGAIAGVIIAVYLIGMPVMHPSVRYVVTEPGPWGVMAAFAAEAAMTFVLMTVVLRSASSPRFDRFTGLFVGVLVASYIMIEAPISGMSMNPARTFGPALIAEHWTALWVYFLAPPLGMLLAAQLHLALRGPARTPCAKMHHRNSQPCIFCEYQASLARRAAATDAGSPPFGVQVSTSRSRLGSPRGSGTISR